MLSTSTEEKASKPEAKKQVKSETTKAANQKQTRYSNEEMDLLFDWYMLKRKVNLTREKAASKRRLKQGRAWLFHRQRQSGYLSAKCLQDIEWKHQ